MDPISRMVADSARQASSQVECDPSKRTPDLFNTLRKRDVSINTGYAPEGELSLPHHEPCGALGLDEKSALLLEVSSGLLGSKSVYCYLRICSWLFKTTLNTF